MKKIVSFCLFSIFLLVGTVAAPNLLVSKSETDPSPAQAGAQLFLTVLLQNYVPTTAAYGSSIAQDIEVELVTSPPFELKVGRERLVSFDMLCENCYKELDYHIYVDPSSQSGTYPLKVKVSYSHAGVVRGLEYDVDIEVRNYKHTVGVSRVELSKTPLAPGDTADVNIAIKNYGVEEIKQVEVTLTAPNDINIVGSTKRFFLNKITSQKEVASSYTLVVDSEAEMGAYQFPLTIKVTDNYGNEQTFEDTIGVQVYSQPDVGFTVRSYDVKTGKISTLVANRGHATAQYTYVKLTGVEASPSQVYIGNLDSDDYSTADFTIVPQEGKATLTVYYVDSNNVEQSMSQEIDVHLVPPSDGTIYISVGVVLIAGLIYWFFLRKPKKS
jgi:hypothetical protein